MPDLGKVLGLAKQTIHGYENGDRNPDLETLSRIADFFGVSTDYLLGRSDSPFHRAPDEVSLRELQENKVKMDRITDEMVKIANRISLAPDEATKQAAQRELEAKQVEMDKVAEGFTRIANRLVVPKMKKN